MYESEEYLSLFSRPDWLRPGHRLRYRRFGWPVLYHRHIPPVPCRLSVLRPVYDFGRQPFGQGPAFSLVVRRRPLLDLRLFYDGGNEPLRQRLRLAGRLRLLPGDSGSLTAGRLGAGRMEVGLNRGPEQVGSHE
jgi:hypothetical protein